MFRQMYAKIQMQIAQLFRILLGIKLIKPDPGMSLITLLYV
jgi:hypothetical protein